MVKAVSLDLDGTLIDGSGAVDGAAKMLADLKALGLRIALAPTTLMAASRGRRRLLSSRASCARLVALTRRHLKAAVPPPTREQLALYSDPTDRS